MIYCSQILYIYISQKKPNLVISFLKKPIFLHQKAFSKTIIKCLFRTHRTANLTLLTTLHYFITFKFSMFSFFFHLWLCSFSYLFFYALLCFCLFIFHSFFKPAAHGTKVAYVSRSDITTKSKFLLFLRGEKQASYHLEKDEGILTHQTSLSNKTQTRIK